MNLRQWLNDPHALECSPRPVAVAGGHYSGGVPAMDGPLADPAKQEAWIRALMANDEFFLNLHLEMLGATVARLAWAASHRTDITPAQREWLVGQVAGLETHERDIKRMLLDHVRKLREAARDGAGDSRVTSIPNAGLRANPDLFKTKTATKG